MQCFCIRERAKVFTLVAPPTLWPGNPNGEPRYPGWVEYPNVRSHCSDSHLYFALMPVWSGAAEFEWSRSLFNDQSYVVCFPVKCRWVDVSHLTCKKLA
ncbi:hypothetical protein AVEN_128140-1 [Araneus ventricosus]|uniref:Uncharacterized protein n=1 Tax=Araneus ventricosus TaxID=182803 RepID=A0A4Y1ZZQ4_ARAVE|nr:hypothetical protein AVEN_128140-1 [Araneus ventricosus]